jgi:hypothetical protein
MFFCSAEFWAAEVGINIMTARNTTKGRAISHKVTILREKIIFIGSIRRLGSNSGRRVECHSLVEAVKGFLLKSADFVEDSHLEERVPLHCWQTVFPLVTKGHWSSVTLSARLPLITFGRGIQRTRLKRR